MALALADKLDTLVGFWAIGEKPTGSGDPYQLRRAALGVIRIVLENDLRFPLFREHAKPHLHHDAPPLPSWQRNRRASSKQQAVTCQRIARHEIRRPLMYAV